MGYKDSFSLGSRGSMMPHRFPFKGILRRHR